jgi:hypothetical protein
MNNLSKIIMAGVLTVILLACGVVAMRVSMRPSATSIAATQPASDIVTVASKATAAILPSPTELPTATPRPTFTPVSTFTSPIPTDLLTSTYILTGPHPTDQQIIEFLQNHHVSKLPIYLASASHEWQRQDVDVNGDGHTEIIISGNIQHTILYIAILGRVGNVWQDWLYTWNSGHYCGEVRAAVKANHVIADWLTCGGGTGALTITWEQQWIQCKNNNCSIIWAAPLFYTDRWGNWTMARNYTVSEVMQPDAKTIRLTIRHFGVTNVQPNEPATPLGFSEQRATARRVVGPDTVDTYRWDGNRYQLTNHKQIAPGIVIVHEFDESTDETILLVDNLLSQSFRQPNGSTYNTGFGAARDEFWGVPPLDKETAEWSPSYHDIYAASHNGPRGQLGEWVAGVVRVTDRPLCRLTVQHRMGDHFDRVGRIEVPCTANLTSLAWADLTGDGQDELLVRTVPPDEETSDTGPGMQRLYIYNVRDGLTQLATLDGTLNGPDGVGIRWEDTDSDGVTEILAGLPLMSLTLAPTTWPDLTRRFQIYKWDAATRTLTPRKIIPNP